MRVELVVCAAVGGLAASVYGCFDATIIQGTGGGAASASASSGGGAAPVDLDWAQWPMPNSTGLPSPASYTATGGVVTDKVTGLMWQQVADAGTYNWNDAKKHCVGLALAGHSDWRLPTQIELISIVDYTQASPKAVIDPVAFPSEPADLFWSSSPVAGSPSGAWGVRFDSGSTNSDGVSYTSRVRCVR